MLKFVLTLFRNWVTALLINLLILFMAAIVFLAVVTWTDLTIKSGVSPNDFLGLAGIDTLFKNPFSSFGNLSYIALSILASSFITVFMAGDMPDEWADEEYKTYYENLDAEVNFMDARYANVLIYFVMTCLSFFCLYCYVTSFVSGILLILPSFAVALYKTDKKRHVDSDSDDYGDYKD